MALVKPKDRRALSDQIRDAIRASGVLAQQVANATGMHKSALSRFLSGERGISVEAMDRVGFLLGLDIVGRKARTKRKKG